MRRDARFGVTHGFPSKNLIKAFSQLSLEASGGHELLNESSKVGFSLGGDPTFFADGGREVRGLRADSLEVESLEFLDFAGLDLVQISTHTREEDASLLLDGHGHVLLLLKKLSELFTSVEKLLSRGIQIGAELSESGDLTVLSELEL